MSNKKYNIVLQMSSKDVFALAGFLSDVNNVAGKSLSKLLLTALMQAVNAEHQEAKLEAIRRKAQVVSTIDSIMPIQGQGQQELDV
jgi:hypothetical protein